MVVALGKVALHQGRTDLLPVWLSFLPLTADTVDRPTAGLVIEYSPRSWQVEANGTYSMLCSLVEAGNSSLLGKKNANVPKIKGVLSGILGTEFCASELAPRVQAAIAKLNALGKA